MAKKPPKNVSITFDCEPELKEAIQSQATKSGIGNMSPYIRQKMWSAINSELKKEAKA